MPALRTTTFACPRCSTALRAYRSDDGLFNYFCPVCRWGCDAIDLLHQPRTTNHRIWNSPPAPPLHLLWLWPFSLLTLAFPWCAMQAAQWDPFHAGALSPRMLLLALLCAVLYVVLASLLPYDGEPHDWGGEDLPHELGVLNVVVFISEHLAAVCVFLLALPGRLVTYTLVSTWWVFQGDKHNQNPPPRKSAALARR